MSIDFYNTMFGYFDQILKTSFSIKDTTSMFSFIENNNIDLNNHIVIEINNWDVSYSILIKKENMEIIYFYREGLYGYTTKINVDKQHFLLKQMLFCSVYNAVQLEILEKITYKQEYVIAAGNIVSAQDIIERSFNENVTSFYNFINDDYNRVNKVSKKEVEEKYIVKCYNRLKQAVNHNSLLFIAEGVYEVHRVTIPYDITIKYHVFKDKYYDSFCDSRSLLSAYVVKNKGEDIYYFYLDF